jgi:hypothetical protein
VTSTSLIVEDNAPITVEIVPGDEFLLPIQPDKKPRLQALLAPESCDPYPCWYDVCCIGWVEVSRNHDRQ